MKNLSIHLNCFDKDKDKENLVSTLSTASNSRSNSSTICTPNYINYFSARFNHSENMIKDNVELTQKVAQLEKIQQRIVQKNRKALEEAEQEARTQVKKWMNLVEQKEHEAEQCLAKMDSQELEIAHLKAQLRRQNREPRSPEFGCELDHKLAGRAYSISQKLGYLSQLVSEPILPLDDDDSVEESEIYESCLSSPEPEDSDEELTPRFSENTVQETVVQDELLQSTGGLANISASLIQEEGTLNLNLDSEELNSLQTRQCPFTDFEVSLNHFNEIKEHLAGSDSSLLTSFDSEIEGTGDLVALPLPHSPKISKRELDMANKIKQQARVIRNHRSFIQQLKGQLEIIIQEHHRTKKENEATRIELQALRDALSK